MCMLRAWLLSKGAGESDNMWSWYLISHNALQLGKGRGFLVRSCMTYFNPGISTEFLIFHLCGASSLLHRFFCVIYDGSDLIDQLVWVIAAFCYCDFWFLLIEIDELDQFCIDQACSHLQPCPKNGIVLQRSACETEVFCARGMPCKWMVGTEHDIPILRISLVCKTHSAKITASIPVQQHP